MTTGLLLARLEIPNEAEFVSVARLVVSSLAADRFDLSEDQLDSVKLSVSEACVIAMNSGCDFIEIECLETPGNLEISFKPVPPISADTEEPPGLALISTLADRCSRDMDHEGVESLQLSFACELSHDA